MATTIVQWFGPNDDNPGCDCGMADALARTDSGELICAERAQELGITTSQAHTDVVGYAYQTEIWGPECILNPLRARGLTKVGPTSIGVERELDAIAERMGIDRVGQSFDSNDFPHVILSGAAHDGCVPGNGYEPGQCGERCAGCGEPINERCPNIPED